MNILDSRFLIFVVVILAIGLGLGHWFASELEASNPNGMWIYTPPADHVGPAPSAYPIGYSFAVFAVGIVTFGLSVIFWILTKFWLLSMRQPATQLLVASIACCVLLFVANSIVEFHYSKKAQYDATDISNDC